MEFSEKLYELRNHKGMTQEELAEELYVSRTAISKWESGKGYPNIDSLRAISKFFKISLDELLSSEEMLEVAESERDKTKEKIRDILYGLLDCSLMMFFVLPFFGEANNGAVREVSLLNLTESEVYVKKIYIFCVIAVALFGVLTLALQNCHNDFWQKYKAKISLLLSVALVMLFMAGMQPYAAAFTFIFLIIKAAMVIKWA